MESVDGVSSEAWPHTRSVTLVMYFCMMFVSGPCVSPTLLHFGKLCVYFTALIYTQGSLTVA